MHEGPPRTIPGANLDGADLLGMQTSNLIRHPAAACVPEAQRAVKVTGADDVLIPGAAHRVAAAVADDGFCAEAPVEVPEFDAAVCAAADCSQGVAWAAIHTTHLQPVASPCRQAGFYWDSSPSISIYTSNVELEPSFDCAPSPSPLHAAPAWCRDSLTPAIAMH